MNVAIKSVFGEESLGLFNLMAETVTREYVEDITVLTRQNGYSPSCEEIMRKVEALTVDLTLKAEWLRENYHVERTYRSSRLTRSCKKIIQRSVNDFIRTAKLLEYKRLS